MFKQIACKTPEINVIKKIIFTLTAGVVVNTYKTLSLDHGMVLCFPGVVFPALKLQGNVFVNLEIGA